MSPYQVNTIFRRSAHFLRIRAGPDANAAVLYQVPKDKLVGSTFTVDRANTKYRGWFRLESISGAFTSSQPGWIVKEWNDIPTLVPKPAKRARASSERTGGSRKARKVEGRREQQSGAGSGLNPTYVDREIRDTSNEVLVYDNGVIVWDYKGDKVFNFAGSKVLVRLVLRKVVVADPGHGMGIVRRMESEAVSEAPFHKGKHPSVVLFLLHSIPGAVDVHVKHGYTRLWLHDGMPLMYRQVSGESQLTFKPLGRPNIEHIAKSMKLGPYFQALVDSREHIAKNMKLDSWTWDGSYPHGSIPSCFILPNGQVSRIRVGQTVRLTSDKKAVKESFEIVGRPSRLRLLAVPRWDRQMDGMCGEMFKVLSTETSSIGIPIISLPSPDGSQEGKWYFPATVLDPCP